MQETQLMAGSGGLGADEQHNPGMGGGSRLYRDFDEDEELEFKVSGVTVELSLKFIVCTESAQKVSAARYITSALTELGYNVTLYEYSWDDYYYALYNGLYDMYYGEVQLRANFDPTELLQTRDEEKNGNTNINFTRSTDRTFENYI